MSNVYALFANPEEAGDALHAVAESELGDCDVHLLTDWSDAPDADFLLKSVSNPVSEIAGQVGPRARPVPDAKNESAGDVAEFFKKSLEKGGQIVVVALADDSFEDRAVSILEMKNAVAVAAADA